MGPVVRNMGHQLPHHALVRAPRAVLVRERFVQPIVRKRGDERAQAVVGLSECFSDRAQSARLLEFEHRLGIRAARPALQPDHLRSHYVGEVPFDAPETGALLSRELLFRQL